MVDFSKRAARAPGVAPGETVLAAVNVFPSPFRVAAAGATSGVVAGGLIGAAIGTAWDARNQKRDAAEAEARPLPDVAKRPPVEPAIPGGGGLLAVTDHRVLVWSIAGLGKPKDLIHAFPIGDVDQVAWLRLDAGWMRGKPASLVLWIGIAAGVLAASAVALASSARQAGEVVAVLGRLRPGRVTHFDPSQPA